jgi:hypothetical protein
MSRRRHLAFDSLDSRIAPSTAYTYLPEEPPPPITYNPSPEIPPPPINSTIYLDGTDVSVPLLQENQVELPGLPAPTPAPTGPTYFDPSSL